MTIATHDSVSIPSDPVYARVYVVSYPARNLKITPQQKATTLAILHVPSTSLAKWPCHIVGSYRIWGAYAASDDSNVPTRNLATTSLVTQDYSYCSYVYRHLI